MSEETEGFVPEEIRSTEEIHESVRKLWWLLYNKTEEPHNRHDDYFPLNMWDDIP